MTEMKDLDLNLKMQILLDSHLKLFLVKKLEREL